MVSTSDLTVDPAKFDPSMITEETKKINAMLEVISARGPFWYEVGAPRYKQMRDAGETPLPKPVYLPDAIETTLPSREPGRQIPIRVYKSENAQLSRGIFLHFHGGGFVIGDHQSQDKALRLYANDCNLIAISVGYRTAPSSPYPAPIHDCIDAAEYLIDYAEVEFGCKLLFMGGGSAGACCAVLATFQVMCSRPEHKFLGLILQYGWFDMTLTLPSLFTSPKLLVLNRVEMQRFKETYLPGLSEDETRHPAISPLFADLGTFGKSLPPAMFLVGTKDALLDDTLLMSVKWMATGAEAVLKVYPGAPHSFTGLSGFKLAEEAWEDTAEFVKERMKSAVDV